MCVCVCVRRHQSAVHLNTSKRADVFLGLCFDQQPVSRGPTQTNRTSKNELQEGGNNRFVSVSSHQCCTNLEPQACFRTSPFSNQQKSSHMILLCKSTFLCLWLLCFFIFRDGTQTCLIHTFIYLVTSV